jgi:hypothetical protein
LGRIGGSLFRKRKGASKLAVHLGSCSDLVSELGELKRMLDYVYGGLLSMP